MSKSSKPSKPIAQPRRITPELVRDALACIPPDIDRDTWARLAMAVKSELAGSDGFDLWNDWSAQGKSYDPHAAKDVWRSVKAGGRVTIGTLFGVAKDHGFRFPDDPEPPMTEEQRQQAQAEAARLAAVRESRQLAEEQNYRRRADEAAAKAQKLWLKASAEGHSPYLDRKGVRAHGVRFEPDGTLVVPMSSPHGPIQNVQRIAPVKPSPEDEARGAREKSFLFGGRKTGLCHWIGLPTGPTTGDELARRVLLVGEGYATCASVFEATGLPIAVAFDGGNLKHVATELRNLWPEALIVVCGDDDRETEARTGTNPGRQKAAAAARAVAVEGAELAGVVFPEGLPDGGTDFNDLAQHAGPAAVAELVRRAVQSPKVPAPRRGAKSGAGGPTSGADDPGQGKPTRGASGGASGSSKGDDDRDDLDGDAAAEQPSGDGLPDPFELDDKGVWFIARDADGNTKRPLWLCAPLRVTARTRADDANGWGLLLEFSDLDGNPKSWAMPSALLSGEGAEWAARLRDMGLDMAHGTRARNLVGQYLNSRRPPDRVTCTDRLGWHPGGVFVLPTKCVGTAEGRRYVFQSETGMENQYRRAGELADWQQTVARLCESNSRLVFGVCAALAGALLQPSGTESGGFHFRGGSSKGKTTTLKIAASVWGRPSYLQTWRATSNAIEGTAMQHCDGVLILDEIGQVDGRELGETVYMLGNAQNKNRSTARGFNRRRLTWRILWLSSGEKSMSDHMAEAGKRAMAGQEVRMADVPLDTGFGMGGLEHVHELEGPGELAEAVTKAAAKHYGTAGRAWLDWLAPLFDGLPSRLAPLIERHRSAIVPEAASEQVRRVGNRFALVSVAGELAIEAGILPWPVGHASWAVRECFNSWLAARGHLDNGEDVAMVRQVRAFIEKNGDALFTWMHRGLDDHRPNTALRAGFKRLVTRAGEPLKMDAATEYLDKNSKWSETTEASAQVEYLVFPEAWREICKGFDSRRVAELLRDRGHLRHEKDRLTIKHRLPGMDKAPVYHLKPSILEDET